ncbi:MAG TPA: hypothetical protein VLH85_04630, partial [Levilinea sp.]|nr:hypothetical protein [Levilinea sp.]
MAMTRRKFIVRMCLAAGAVLLKACTPARETPPTPSVETIEWQPAYMKLEAEGKFADRIQQAFALLEQCEICPRRCGVNRLEGRIGFCRAPEKVVVHSFSPHFGEELPLVGRSGSGTIFFSNCNLRCVFCQNWPIAHEGRGTQISDERLAEMMLDL